MTKRLLFLLALCVSSQAFSQDAAIGPKKRKKFRLGISIAPAVDWFTSNTNEVSLDAARFKFGAGLMSELAFANNYALTIGLEWKGAGGALAYQNAYYISQGQDDNKNPFQLLTRNYRNDYINIPVTMKLMTNEIGYFTYFAQVGFDLSVLVSAKAQDVGNLVERTDSMTINLTPKERDYQDVYGQTSFANIRLRVGAGAEWNFSGNTSLVFSVTYHHGFIDVLRDASDERIAENEGIFRATSLTNALSTSEPRTPFAMSANLHYVALNIGILF